MKFNTIGKKIALSHYIILFFFTVTMLITSWKLHEIYKTTDRIRNQRGPTVMSSLEMLSNIKELQYKMNKWILAKEKERRNHKDSLNLTWSKMIDNSLVNISSFSRKWTSDKNKESFEKIKRNLDQLNDYYHQIQDTLETRENQPFRKVFNDKLKPLSIVLKKEIQTIIDLEKKRPSGVERKNILSIVTDLRISQWRAIDNLSSYLRTGNDQLKSLFMKELEQNDKAFDLLRLKQSSLNKNQRFSFARLKEDRERLRSLSYRLFTLRSSKSWNKSLFLFQSKLSPLINKTAKTLKEMVRVQQILMENDFILNESQESRLKTIIILLFVFGIALSSYLSIRSVRSITIPLYNILNVIEKISKGNYGMKINNTSIFEINLLKKSIQIMQKNLTELTKGLTNEKLKFIEENWIKSSLASIMEKVQGHKDLQHFAKDLINSLVSISGGQVGVFYVRDDISKEYNEKDKERKKENLSLSLLSSYAHTRRKNNPSHIKLGEGIIGQCALEKKTIILSEIPDDYIIIRSGLGKTKPRNIIVTPILFENFLLGVLEIGSIESFTKSQLTVFDQVANNIGVIMISMTGRINTEELLLKSQSMGEKLKNQQEELRASNEELEEKTEHLEKQKFEIEKKKFEIEETKKIVEKKADELELASKYKSEFLANMSHELRTPLNSLLILSKSLANNDDGNLTEEQIEEMKIIYEGGNELLSLVNDILDLSKVEAGKMEASINKEDIASILSSLKKTFLPISKDNSIKFFINDNCHNGFLETDRMRCEQILKNFLSNAFKFSKKGSIRLEAFYPSDEIIFRNNHFLHNNSVGFSVIDTGIGIPLDKQKQIFEAFQQQDGSTARKFGGTGLGLTISKKLSSILRGEIHMVSEEGGGSTFTLYLPIKNGHTNIDENIKIEEKQVIIQVEKRSDPKVFDDHIMPTFVPDLRKEITEKDKVLLIVEDDKKLAKVLSKLAIKKGFKYLIAGDGKSALELVKRFRVDGVILDIELPILDGLTVLDQLKLDSKTRNIPVHVLSGKDENSTSLKKGADSFISKPAELSDLEQMFDSFNFKNNKNLKEVLIVEDDESNQEMIDDLIGQDNIKTTFSKNGKEALDKTKNKTFDCIILDFNLPDMTCLELLESLEKSNYRNISSTVIHTGKDLSKDEYNKLNKYTDRIVIKGVNAPERLLDEVSLFLHSVETSFPEEQRKIVQIQDSFDKIFEGQKILLVDDDMRNIYALSKILKRENLLISIAENGKIALDLLRGHEKFDLVIMDIMMPIMDGFQAMKEIRKIEKLKDLPIIALTAKTMIEDKEKCFKLGASDFLNKPVDSDQLLSLVRVWLSGASNKKYQLKSA